MYQLISSQSWVLSSMWNNLIAVKKNDEENQILSNVRASN